MGLGGFGFTAKGSVSDSKNAGLRAQFMRVIIESPYAGVDLDLNVEYARRCLRDSLNRGEAPFASHLLYTQVLDDNVKEQRRLGTSRALSWYEAADMICVYMDRGITVGMRFGISYARQLGLARENRYINDQF